MRCRLIADLFVGFFTLVLTLPVMAGNATMVLYNGKVVTVDQDFSLHQAIAIDGERILAVGSNSDIKPLARANTQMINLDGRTVIPGLIDNHAHIMRSAQNWKHEVRFDGVSTRDEALQRIAQKAQQLGDGEWIFSTGGFSPIQFGDDNGALRIEELDQAAPDNPVLLQHLFGMAFANTQAFRAIDIEEDTEIAWLEIANDIDLNAEEQPTGVVRGAAMRRMLAKITEPTLDQYKQRATGLNRYLNSMGLTAVLDATGGLPGNPDFDAYQALDKEKALSLRVFHLFPAPDYTPDQVGQFAAILKGLPRFENSDYFQRVGVGERLYGPIHDSMVQPAASQPEHVQAFASLAQQTAAAGWHLHQHATHIQSINQHLDAYEAIAREHDISKLRWTFTHADGIEPEAVERASKLGMMIATQSRRLIGGSKFSHPLPLIAFADPPLKQLQDSGIRWGLGTDTMTVAQANPFFTLWWAVTGKAINGEQLTDEKVSREQALMAHTRENAWFMFRENDLGSLEPGKLADILVLDRDYLTVEEDEIRRIKPQMTLVGGRVVYQQGK